MDRQNSLPIEVPDETEKNNNNFGEDGGSNEFSLDDFDENGYPKGTVLYPVKPFIFVTDDPLIDGVFVLPPDNANELEKQADEGTKPAATDERKEDHGIGIPLVLKDETEAIDLDQLLGGASPEVDPPFGDETEKFSVHDEYCDCCISDAAMKKRPPPPVTESKLKIKLAKKKDA